MLTFIKTHKYLLLALLSIFLMLITKFGFFRFLFIGFGTAYSVELGKPPENTRIFAKRFSIFIFASIFFRMFLKFMNF